MKKTTILLSCAVALLLTMLIVVCMFTYDIFFDNGINSIKISQSWTGKRTLHIGYGWVRSNVAYSVRVMNEDEGIYFGEQYLENDGLLGEYRIEVIVGGDLLSRARHSGLRSEFAEKYPAGENHELKDVHPSLKGKYNVRITGLPCDTSPVAIYIGSDEPIKVKEQDGTKTGPLRRSFNITLN